MKDLPKGTKILTENPLKPFLGISLNTQDDILRAFSRLSINDQASYLQLHHDSSLSEQRLRVCDVFAKNGFGVKGGTSIVLKGSRFNHSCAPNAITSYNSATKVQGFRLIRNVEEGEEITISYLSGRLLREERRKLLKETYGFNCGCVACDQSTEFGRRSDTRRMRIQELWNGFGGETGKDLPQEWQKMVEEYEELATEEALFEEIMDFYEHMSLVLGRRGDVEEASKMAKKLSEIGVICWGQ